MCAQSIVRPTRARHCRHRRAVLPDYQSNPGGNAMLVEAQVTINGSKAAVWAAITDIENASEIVSGILKIEVVEKPASGLTGLRWRETRMLFDEPTTVE